MHTLGFVLDPLRANGKFHPEKGVLVLKSLRPPPSPHLFWLKLLQRLEKIYGDPCSFAVLGLLGEKKDK